MPLSVDGILFDVLTSDPGSPVEGQQWFNTTDKQLKLYQGGGITAYSKRKVDTVNPTVNADSSQGYSVGSRWLNTVSSVEYLCSDATVGAAVWKPTRSILQVLFAEVSADTTTTSNSFVDLLSIPITTVLGSRLLIYSSFAASNTNNGKIIAFRVTVDGVAKRGCGLRYSGTPADAGGINLMVTGLSAALHTVKLQWLTDANTARVRPVVAPDYEHAALVIKEVLV